VAMVGDGNVVASTISPASLRTGPGPAPGGMISSKSRALALDSDEVSLRPVVWRVVDGQILLQTFLDGFYQEAIWQSA
jgi:hypothetical protein